MKQSRLHSQHIDNISHLMTAPQRTPVDCIIHARWIIPVQPSASVLANHALVVKDGLIVDLLASDAAEARYKTRKRHRLDSHALIPGLINTHGHAAMTLFRGLADDLDLMTWLNNHIWPAEQRWVSDDFVTTGTELAIAEMLLSGTTCFSDMYFYPSSVARVAHRHKIRAHIFFPVLEFPSNWAADADEYFNKGLKVFNEYRSHETIQIGIGLHAPYTVSNASLQRARILADELDCNIQMHLHETAQEITDSMRDHGRRPLQRLDELDLLSPHMQCVHMTQVNPDEIELLRQNGCHVIHCPESNLKLASGFCPVTQYTDAGINVALGTDGAASNNDLDMLGELKTAALLAKGVAQDPTALTAHEALRMATINGAKALGIDAITGSLEAGKAADVVAVDLSELAHQPVYDPASHLVYTSSGRNVSHVWVNGKILVKDRKLLNFDSAGLAQKVEGWRVKISAAENQQVMKF